jgi:hypothetical protein
MIHTTPHYRRIACLCTEAVETLYLLGAEDLVAGISGFTVYPPEARQQKPKISGFSSGKLEKILAVEPDLVVGYSSLQSDMLKEVAEAGVDILHFNHHSVDGVLRMVRVLGSLTGRLHAAELLCEQLEGQISAARLEAAARDAAGLPRPRQGAHRSRPANRGRPPAGPDGRQLVRQALPSGNRGRARRLARRTSGAQRRPRPYHRDQVCRHPGARPHADHPRPAAAAGADSPMARRPRRLTTLWLRGCE